MFKNATAFRLKEKNGNFSWETFVNMSEKKIINSGVDASFGSPEKLLNCWCQYKWWIITKKTFITSGSWMFMFFTDKIEHLHCLDDI